MTSKPLRTGWLLAASLCALAPFAQAAVTANPGDSVDNFRLNDHRGVSHELHYLSDMKAVVLLAQGNSCKESVTAAHAVKELGAKYRSQGVEFLSIDSNLKDSREAVAKTAADAGIDLPVLIDETQLIGESLNLTRNGEVLVINPKDWKLAYRGDVKNAADAVDALVNGQPVKTAKTAVAGCPIAMPERDKRAAHAKISYEKTIAPMLQDKCVACHRDGGIGPWQMSGYNIVKGFAPMIREVVRTQRMPPWHADPHYSVFSNDRSLTNEEVKTLVHWIEAGAPRSEGGDPLAAAQKKWPEWVLGQPDLVVETPAFKVPATGVIPYQMVTVENPLDRDVWIRAIDYIPGDRTVLHHVIANASLPSATGGRSFGGIPLSNYVPGAEPLQIPTDNGIFLPKGSKFNFQMHYTPTGKEATDVTRFGLYFLKEAPKHNFRSASFANPRLKIPANTKEHVETATQTFSRDVLIYSLHPHSHFRGKSASFVAKYPDGTEELLLNVPRYDFNWQSTYDLTEPKKLPAGTKVVYTTVFDNSAQNKANPDPNRTVTWGEQSWDEMVFGVIRYRFLDEDNTAPKTAQATN